MVRLRGVLHGVPRVDHRADVAAVGKVDDQGKILGHLGGRPQTGERDGRPLRPTPAPHRLPEDGHRRDGGEVDATAAEPALAPADPTALAERRTALWSVTLSRL